MTGQLEYQIQLRQTAEWETYLLNHSGLPGPRANLELAYAAAREDHSGRLLPYLNLSDTDAPVNSPQVFLLVCAVLSLANPILAGEEQYLKILRVYASDTRWRVREAVAMTFQEIGVENIDLVISTLSSWVAGNWYEKRAAAAALAEPKLLNSPAVTHTLLIWLDSMTASILLEENRKTDSFTAFRKGMGYAWSVAVSHLPQEGKKIMQKWFGINDKDIRWIMRENLKKNRLQNMDPVWVADALAFINS